MPLDGIPGQVSRRLFNQNLKPRLSVIIAVAVVTLLWALVIIGASIHDNNLHLPEPGRGLLDHYGFQVSFIAAPLALITCYFTVSYFLRLLRNIDQLLIPEADPATVREFIKPHVESLFLRSNWRNGLWLFMIVGAATSIAIFKKLDAPVDFWGNDVFNAMSYRYSFIVANLYLFVVWTFICPVILFCALHITFSTAIIVANLKKCNLFRLNFLHIDKCGGMSQFGTLNFLIMMIYAWPFGAFYALHITHRLTYSSLIAGTIIASAALIMQSVYGIYWVSKTIKSERESFVAALNQRIGKAMEGTKKNFAAAVAAMEYRDRVLSISPYPYSAGVFAAVNVLRFAPTVISGGEAFFLALKRILPAYHGIPFS
jgi:hypothetical protein